MSELDDLTELAKRVKDLQRRAHKAQGALDSLQKRLQAEFECATLEEAAVLLEQFETDEKKAERKFTKALKKFEEKWGDLLQ